MNNIFCVARAFLLKISDKLDGKKSVGKHNQSLSSRPAKCKKNKKKRKGRIQFDTISVKSISEDIDNSTSF